ncbi:unnamed protein product [Lymnaea stagnalis]|uniref:NYN domain-containing protein n=1 Tax=Lymnaea stagnalis TaxID=6523 RepID=A0AAV2H045_LYMST
MASSNNDNETDAQGEAPSLAVRSSPGSSAPNSNSSIQNVKGIKNNHRYDEYVAFMPPPLNKDNIDILIICAQNDEDSALILKKDIEKLKKYYRVEIIDSELTQPDILEEFFKRSMFYFLFVTEEFSIHGKALFKAHTFLNETLEDKDKNWSIIPVYPCSNKDKKYLNINYRGLTPIRYFESKDKFSLSINNLFEHWTNKLIIKDRQLQLDRERYFDEHETELIDLKKYYLLKETLLNEQSVEESESLFVKDKPHDPPIEENAQRTLCDTLAKQKLDDIGDNVSNADAATPATFKNPVDKRQTAGTEIYFGDDTEVDGPPTYPANHREKVYKDGDGIFPLFKIMNPAILDRPSSGIIETKQKDAIQEKELIGVFWDLQNCPVPRNKSAADIIERIRAKYILVDANNVEKCFYCITDVTKEHKKTREAITSCGVDLLHMCSDKKNASDIIIDAKMREFYENFGAARAKVILISSDVDFSQTLAYLKKRRCHVILLHRVNIKPELLHSVNESCSYEDLIKELPDKHEILSESEPFLIVHGYKLLPGEKAKDFKNILEKFFSPWKGKVVNQRGTKFGILKFDSLELAKSAKENTNGEDPFQENTKIIVCFLEGAPDEIRKSVDKILSQNPGKNKTGGITESGDRSLTPPNSGRIAEIQDMGSD